MIAKGVCSTHTLSLYRENKGTDSILTLERTKEARVQVLFVLSLLEVEERSSIPTPCLHVVQPKKILHRKTPIPQGFAVIRN